MLADYTHGLYPLGDVEGPGATATPTADGEAGRGLALDRYLLSPGEAG